MTKTLFAINFLAFGFLCSKISCIFLPKGGLSHDLSIPFELEDIKKCIPHREPFLLIDRIVEFEDQKSIVAERQNNLDDPLFRGHFPGNQFILESYLLKV